MEGNDGTAGCCVYSVFCFTLAATSLVELHKSPCLLLLLVFCVCVGNLCRLLKIQALLFPKNKQFSSHSSEGSDFVFWCFPLGHPYLLGRMDTFVHRLGVIVFMFILDQPQTLLNN